MAMMVVDAVMLYDRCTKVSFLQGQWFEGCLQWSGRMMRSDSRAVALRSWREGYQLAVAGKALAAMVVVVVAVVVPCFGSFYVTVCGDFWREVEM